MSKIYPTYQTKAHFSEILRQVRAGQTVVISHRGEEVAEIRPVTRTPSVTETLDRLEERGIISPRDRPQGRLEALGKRPGALARFLAERD